MTDSSAEDTRRGRLAAAAISESALNGGWTSLPCHAVLSWRSEFLSNCTVDSPIHSQKVARDIMYEINYSSRASTAMIAREVWDQVGLDGNFSLDALNKLQINTSSSLFIFELESTSLHHTTFIRSLCRAPCSFHPLFMTMEGVLQSGGIHCSKLRLPSMLASINGECPQTHPPPRCLCSNSPPRRSHP
jgi:hypothetical protein